MSMTLNIKVGSQASIPIEVSDEDSLLSIKAKLCSVKNLDPKITKIRILFQGKELKDSEILKNFDLFDHSVLHAILSPWRPDDNEASSAGSCRLVNEGGEHSQDVPPQGRCSLYYVYCKTECRSVQAGRLRVRCSVCKQGTLRVLREPDGWSDVLQAGQIRGECLGDTCSGHTAEFYFKCNGHISPEVGESGPVILPQITTNLQGQPCITCCDVTRSVLVFRCLPSHLVCLPCFEEYCTTRLNERGFVYSSQHGYTLGCPAGCEDSQIEEAHHFRVLGADQYERYQRFATEECIMREGGVICPAPGCGEGLFPGDIRRVQCVRQGCKFLFCRQCNQPYHDGECDLARITAYNSRLPYRQVILDAQNEASLQTITTTAKPCPKCRAPTEKTGGCMHIACSRCGADWCWVCHKEWSRDCQGDHWFG